ncbi:Uncharacterised protein [Vibrio cholerae]|nr:Uncharacterised protein [Vibrio cholerae]
MGMLFNSIPRCSKSCCGRLPAVAPKCHSSNWPTQPLSLRRSGGTVMPASSASSAKLSPAICWARVSNSC